MNVLIADDQTLFRDMMLALFEKESDINHIGSVSNGADALAFCASRQVDLVLMDIRMPEMDGITAAGKILQAAPSTRIILLTAFAERDLSGLYQMENICGVLLKDIHAEQLIQAIRLSTHDVFVANRELLPVLSAASFNRQDNNLPIKNDETGFTSIDLEILQCLSGGMSNKEIAETINYSEGTVKSHISQLLAETGLKDRTQLALFALRNHLVQ